MLQVAYISPIDNAARPKKQTAKEKLHADAIASIAAWRVKARIKAFKMFEPEFEALRNLELKAKINQN